MRRLACTERCRGRPHCRPSPILDASGAYASPRANERNSIAIDNVGRTIPLHSVGGYPPAQLRVRLSQYQNCRRRSIDRQTGATIAARARSYQQPTAESKSQLQKYRRTNRRRANVIGASHQVAGRGRCGPSAKLRGALDRAELRAE